MATVVTGSPVDTSNNAGFFVAMVILLLAVILFIIFGLPYIRGGSSNGGATQVNIPNSNGSGTNTGGSAPGGKSY
ncbi:MAG TPA: hypothetical protein VEW42_05780 [Candidatus Eisenbacteria bacterium]|nr:hypothetical protein [Candidatus Eisenbacteria bacterium]